MEQKKGIIQLVELTKEYPEIRAVDAINLNIIEGEFITFLGSSGCGKTTTLRMIAGFEEPTSGHILLNGRQVDGMLPHERDVNTVFQSYALFPHMNIYNNVAFGLKMKKMAPEVIREKVKKILDMVQLSGYENRKPDQLSGGQKQRIAIARALVNQPKVLLLDEPLGALDLKLRKQMQLELKHLQQKLGLTFVYVTHDQEEALTMSDRIAIMNKGRIEQLGTSEEIYERPKTKFVADFIGETNLIKGIIEKGSNRDYLVTKNVKIPVVANEIHDGEEMYLALRPERITISRELSNPSPFSLSAHFKEIVYIGSLVKIVFTLVNGDDVVVTEQAGDPVLDDGFYVGQELRLNWKPEQGLIVKE
jgi:spermidine/putrescine transport system ATP-binding protein